VAEQDQLEIISANGQIEFYSLNPNKGITNIGRHPENDIVLDSPGVAPFHAMLDHRQKPYRFMLLANQGKALIGEEPLPPHTTRALQNWASITLDGYTLVLVEGNGQQPAGGMAGYMPPAGGGVVSGAPLPAMPASLAPPTSRPEAPEATGQAPSPPPSGGQASPSGPQPDSPDRPRPAAQQAAAVRAGPLNDHEDQVILTELDGELEQTVEPGQAINYQLTVINGGDIVAMFHIEVLGVDPSWVMLSEQQVNLFEGDRTSVIISITPPREPSSQAGLYHIGFRVTSPNYAGHMSQRAARLIINPYYEFAVGELSPKQQTISWFKTAGQVTLPIFNRGNSDAVFHLEAEDDERGASFEFNVPGETAGRVRQADMRMPPDSMVTVPIVITPHSRRLVGFRKKSYSFTVTTTLPEGMQTPRSMLGQLQAKPLIGPLTILLLTLLFVLLIVLIFNPFIRTFNSEGSSVRVVRAGEMITLNWNASSLANLRVNPLLGDLEAAVGTATVVPTADVVYELRAENWLSRLNSNWFSDTAEVRVFVTPIPPEIRFFEVDKEAIIEGEEITLSWNVVGADDLILEINSVPQSLADHAGTLADDPQQETTYRLVAINPYKEESASHVVRVNPPTPTPIPTPEIRKFIVNPPVIVAGESVTLEWEIAGADDVSISGVGAGLPLIQTITQSPQETTNYVLNAANGPARIEPIARVVFVTPPSPTPTSTPEPDAPEIVLFASSATELIQGKATPADDEKNITLNWLVKGTVTNVELNAGTDIGIFSNLDPEGSLPVTVSKNTSFVLTAFNQDKTASRTIQVEVVDATPTPKPTDTPEPSATPLPTPQILSFEITSPPAPQVVKKSSTEYDVQVNTAVTFEWEADAAATGGTELTLAGAVIGSGSTKGSAKDITITASGSYRLIGKNAEGKESSPAIINVTIVNQPPPNPPYNVMGTEDQPNDTNTLTWSWDPDLARSPATGYRVYRADVGGTFSPITEITDPNTKTYTDSGLGSTCDKIYYVVAIYQDLQGNTKESSVSTNSWYSSPGPCP